MNTPTADIFGLSRKFALNPHHTGMVALAIAARQALERGRNHARDNGGHCIFVPDAPEEPE